jgi:hypothetical protein
MNGEVDYKNEYPTQAKEAWMGPVGILLAKLFGAGGAAALAVGLTSLLGALCVAFTVVVGWATDELAGVGILRGTVLFRRDLEAGPGASFVVASAEAALGAGTLVFTGGESLRRRMMTLLLALALTFGLESFAIVLGGGGGVVARGGGGGGAAATSLISAALGGGCDGKRGDD